MIPSIVFFSEQITLLLLPYKYAKDHNQAWITFEEARQKKAMA
ncbi:hypothetical protein [Klebsiella pneumoniae ISC21]|nr:hypothetical protein [Klebsiella pneumoniae ISC21]